VGIKKKKFDPENKRLSKFDPANKGLTELILKTKGLGISRVHMKKERRSFDCAFLKNFSLNPV
jgi:hypothetical protein